MKKSKIIYMCGVEWQHELGEGIFIDRHTNTLKEAKERCCCHKECGIVKLEIKEVSWPVKQDSNYYKKYPYKK